VSTPVTPPSLPSPVIDGAPASFSASYAFDLVFAFVVVLVAISLAIISTLVLGYVVFVIVGLRPGRVRESRVPVEIGITELLAERQVHLPPAAARTETVSGVACRQDE